MLWQWHVAMGKALRLFHLPLILPVLSHALMTHLHNTPVVTCLQKFLAPLLLPLLLLQLRSPNLALTVTPTIPAATQAVPIKRSHTCAMLQLTS
jgi:hypothetical protein